VALPVSPEVVPVVFVPERTSPTDVARAVLPSSVAHQDAAFNAGRSALLVAALTSAPELLWDATADRLHQEQRREAYPQALDLVLDLRVQGWPAVVSGAGPSVLVLATRATAATVGGLAVPGYRAHLGQVGSGAATRLSGISD
jgi:homoserine kinase